MEGLLYTAAGGLLDAGRVAFMWAYERHRLSVAGLRPLLSVLSAIPLPQNRPGARYVPAARAVKDKSLLRVRAVETSRCDQPPVLGISIQTPLLANGAVACSLSVWPDPLVIFTTLPGSQRLAAATVGDSHLARTGGAVHRSRRRT